MRSDSPYCATRMVAQGCHWSTKSRSGRSLGRTRPKASAAIPPSKDNGRQTRLRGGGRQAAGRMPTAEAGRCGACAAASAETSRCSASIGASSARGPARKSSTALMTSSACM